MSYWAETMQDDAYILAADGWSAKTYRIVEKNKQGKETDRGWSCDLVPKELIVSRYFPEKRDTLKNLEGELETRQSRRGEIEEEQSGDEGFFADWEKVNKGAAAARLKQIKVSSNDAEERTVLEEYLSLLEEEASLKKELKEAEAELDRQAYGTYPGLSVDEIKNLVVEEKWMKTLSGRIEESLEQISQSLSRRLTELSERYGTPLPELERRTDELSTTVEGHLKRMGFVW
jgi:type I restriction enzyme M protein